MGSIPVSGISMKFKIKRFDGENSKFDIFDIKPKPKMSVLEALFQIQDENDSTLAFRYSCRGAVCGSCAMLINRKFRLACRTQASEVDGEKVLSVSAYGPLAKPEFKIGEEILIEPLPNLPLIKDLVVDMGPFFKHYGSVEPWFDIENTGHGETLMSEKDTRKVDRYAACILCGLCYGACPVSARDKDFLGPAALAKAWRFYSDPRYRNRKEMLTRVDFADGVWACDRVYRCVEVCPKQVPPTNAIIEFTKKIIWHKIKTIIR